MKVINLAFLLVLFLQFNGSAYNAASQAAKNEKMNPKSSLYKILKIDSLQNVYIIYAKKGTLIFKLVSKKEISLKCSKIIVGKSYVFEINSLFPPDITQKRAISGLRFEGTLIKLEGGGIVWDLFVTDNLTGLCYKR